MAKRRYDSLDDSWDKVQAFKQGGATFFQKTTAGAQQAQALAKGQGLKLVTLPMINSYIVATHQLYGQVMGGQAPGQMGSKGSGAGGLAGSAGSAGGGALAATQFGKTYTGGGQYFSIGATENRAAGLSAREGEFEGVDSFTPDDQVSPGRTPKSTNWDDLRRLGAKCVRSGTAKLDDDRDTVDISSSSIDASYRGLSLARMPGSGANTDRLLMCFADNAIGSARSSQVTTMHLTNSSLRWGQALNLQGWPGPKIALSDQGSQVLRVTSDYTNVFSAANDGLRKVTVKQLVIRYSTVTYPLDKDGMDNTSSTALADHSTWGGESTTDDSGTLTAARYYVSAWAVSILGVSERSTANLTLA